MVETVPKLRCSGNDGALGVVFDRQLSGRVVADVIAATRPASVRLVEPTQHRQLVGHPHGAVVVRHDAGGGRGIGDHRPNQNAVFPGARVVAKP